MGTTPHTAAAAPLAADDLAIQWQRGDTVVTFIHLGERLLTMPVTDLVITLNRAGIRVANTPAVGEVDGLVAGPTTGDPVPFDPTRPMPAANIDATWHDEVLAFTRTDTGDVLFAVTGDELDKLMIRYHVEVWDYPGHRNRGNSTPLPGTTAA